MKNQNLLYDPKIYFEQHDKFERKPTGYPSIDKPWLKYYSEEARNAPLPECTIYQYLYENNKNHLDDVAIIYFNKKITYRELFVNIDKTASAFSGIGIEKGDVVIICTLNTPEMIYVTYALNKIGAVPSFEYPTLSETDMSKTVEKMEAKVFVVLDLFIDKYTNVCAQATHTIVISPSESMPLGKKFLYNIKFKRYSKLNYFYQFIKTGIKNYEIYKEHTTTAILVHTGGTTGVPKSVMLSSDNLNAVAFQFRISGMNYNRQDTLLHCVPPFHAYGFSIGVHMPLTLGMTICMSLKIDNDSISNLFYEIRPNHFVGAGPHISAIIPNDKMSKTNLSFIKTIAVGGAAISETLEFDANNFLREHGANVKLVIGYGMTETCAAACANMNHCSRIGSVGIPLPKNNIKIVDTDTLRELPYDNTGELFISTPSMMIGYRDNELENSNVFYNDINDMRWIRTGDLATIDEDGFVFIKGRIKRIFTIKNEMGMVYKVYPDYIEQTVSKMEGISSCAAICQADKDFVNRILLFVVVNQQINVNILNNCKKILPDHMIPKEICIINSIPLTPAGKIDYQVLQKLAENKNKDDDSLSTFK